MTYLLLALAALVYLWPAGKQFDDQPTTRLALSALAIVRDRLVRTQSFSGPCQEAVRTLTLTLIEGTDP